MNRKRVIGSGVAALLCGVLVAVGASAYFVGTLNRGQKAQVEQPAQSYAETLAAAIQLDPSPPAVSSQVARLQTAARHVKLIAVIVEPASAKYRFLRKRRFLAHPDPKKLGQPLDRKSPEDKALYDATSVVRKLKQTQLHIASAPEKPLEVRAAAPVFRDGKHFATVVVVTQPPAIPNPYPAWPLGLALGVLVLLGLAAGAFAGRARHGLVVSFTGGYALFAWWWIGKLEAHLAADLTANLAALKNALGGLAVLPKSAMAGTGGGFLLAGTIAALLVGIFAIIGFGQRISEAAKTNRLAYTLLLPAGLGMALLVFLPFSYGLGLGFFNHAHGSYTFVGLANFAEILSGGGRPLSHPLNFYFTLGVTILWTAVNVVLHVSIGLGLALILKDPLLRFKGIYRALLILPWAMPNYITALIWKGMFHYQYGAVNHILESLGLEKISWFSSFSTAFIANVTTNTWLGFPFMMVVALGALQSIPSDVYEAAAVDGAPKSKVFWHITMPLLKPALYPAIVLGSIWTFNMFNIIYLVSAGAPNGSSDILITEAYRWAFERGDKYGLAAAYALVIFAILWGYSKLANRLARVSEEG